MKKSYYSILTWGIQIFDVSLKAKLVHKTFDLIIYPNHWFFIGNLSSNDLFYHLHHLSIPFIAIKDGEGIWFLDLAYGFNRFSTKVGDVRIDFYEERVGDIIFVHNYPIFGDFSIEQVSKFQAMIPLENIKNACKNLIFDLVIKLKKIEVPFNEPLAYFYIHPKNFVLRGPYLNHYVEPNTPNLTLKFVKEAAELIAKLSKSLKIDLKLKGDRIIKTKKTFLDVFETRLLEELSINNFKQNYSPSFNIIDNNARLAKIKKEITKLLRKN